MRMAPRRLPRSLVRNLNLLSFVFFSGKKCPAISSSFFFPECMSYLIWEFVFFIICASHTFNSIVEGNSCTALNICVHVCITLPLFSPLKMFFFVSHQI